MILPFRIMNKSHSISVLSFSVCFQVWWRRWCWSEKSSWARWSLTVWHGSWSTISWFVGYQVILFVFHSYCSFSLNLSTRWIWNQGFRFFSKLEGRSDPWSKKWWVIFWNDGPHAYQTSHSWHLGCKLYLHTDTDTCMHICILTADYTVKPVLSGHSKKKTNYCVMQVKSNAECSDSAMLLTFIKLPFVIKIFVLSFLSGCLRHVLLSTYMNFLFCGVCRHAVRWVFLLKWDFFHN